MSDLSATTVVAFTFCNPFSMPDYGYNETDIYAAMYGNYTGRIEESFAEPMSNKADDWPGFHMAVAQQLD